MNEKIKEIIVKSNIDIRGHYDESGNTPQQLQEFAELIVRECIAITDELVNRNTDGTWTSTELYTDYNGALSEVKRRITEHFELNCYTQEDLDEAHKRGVELAKKLRVE